MCTLRTAPGAGRGHSLQFLEHLLSPLRFSQPVSSSQLTMLTKHCLAKDGPLLTTSSAVSQGPRLPLSLQNCMLVPGDAPSEGTCGVYPGISTHSWSMLLIQGGGRLVPLVGLNQLSLLRYNRVCSSPNTQLSYQQLMIFWR